MTPVCDPNRFEQSWLGSGTLTWIDNAHSSNSGVGGGGGGGVQKWKTTEKLLTLKLIVFFFQYIAHTINSQSGIESPLKH